MWHERGRHDRVALGCIAIPARAREISLEEGMPFVDDKAKAFGTDIVIERRDETRLVTIDDEELVPRHRTGSHGAPKLADVVAPVTPAPDDDDRAEPLHLAHDAKRAISA
jgi:hypothetical protein